MYADALQGVRHAWGSDICIESAADIMIYNAPYIML